MKELSLWSSTLAVLAVVGSPALAGEVTAKGAFEQLKTLAGGWEGPIEGEGEEAEAEAKAAGPAIHEIQVSAAGTVVMETMAPGTEHEMINMYHLDGDDLLLTHYCAGGNQPQMKLNRQSSTNETLVFDFIGGTNLDPTVDPHIHNAKIQMVDSDHFESIWQSWNEGKQYGTMTFSLARRE